MDIAEMKAEIRLERDRLNKILVNKLHAIEFKTRIEQAWETTLDRGRTTVFLSAFSETESFISAPNGAIVNFHVDNEKDVERMTEVILCIANMGL
jgi:hypothetical protein